MRMVSGAFNPISKAQYAVSHDGRFLINTVLDDASSPITLLLKLEAAGEVTGGNDGQRRMAFAADARSAPQSRFVRYLPRVLSGPAANSRIVGYTDKWFVGSGKKPTCA